MHTMLNMGCSRPWGTLLDLLLCSPCNLPDTLQAWSIDLDALGSWAVCDMLISVLNYSNRLEVRDITALFLWTMKPQLTVLSGKNGAGTSKSKSKR